MELSLVIPTYNERDNVKVLIEKVFSVFKKNKIKGEIIVVDDNSPDGTGDVVEGLRKKHKNLRIIHRKGKLGLASALLDGFAKANGNTLGAMDADLSHPAEKIPEMLNLIKNNGVDFVIGSRYVKGGKIEGWSLLRKVLSRGAIFLSRFFTSVKDTTAGFFMIKKECIKDKKLNPKGLHILMELIIKADYKKIKEVPITFVNRKKGKSKSNPKEVIDFLRNLISYLPYRG